MTYATLTALTSENIQSEIPDPIRMDDQAELERWVSTQGLGEVVNTNDGFDAGNVVIPISDL